MPIIEIDPNDPTLIAVHSEFREKDLVKQVPGTRWDKDERLWKTPLSWGACQAFRGIFADSLQIGENLWEWAQEQRRWIDYAMYMRDQLDDPTFTSEPDLYPFQRAGVRFLMAARRALIADEMGSGKTVQIIRAIANLQESLPALIVCPNSMKYTWQKEFTKWAPDIRTVVIDGGAAQRRKQIAEIENFGADVAIINWESLRLHTRLEGYGNLRLRRCEQHGGSDPKVNETSCESHPKEFNLIGWRTVVADEAHRAKDPKAKQSRALWAVASEANYRFAATGTPIANHPGDLWSLMRFVSPEDFPRKTQYVDRYCLQSWNAFGGMDIVGIRPETRAEFARIVDPRMIRRLKSVVLPHLPPKTYVTREVTMTAKQAKAYNQMAEHMIAELEDGDVTYATNPLTKLTRLSQFACAYAEVDDAGDVKLSDPSCKLDAMMDILEEADGEQVVVFAESRQLIELAAKRLEKAGITFGQIHGNIPPAERQVNVDQFQANKLQVMLVTMGAGGEGITLTAARIAVFLQRSWSLVKNKQAEDRIHRPGQDADKVEIIDVVAQGTIEETRAEAIKGKEARLEEVVRDQEFLRRMLEMRA